MTSLKKLCRFALVATVLIAASSVLGSCSEEKYGLYLYKFIMSKTDANATSAEAEKIFNAYRTALSFKGTETSRAGNEDECNKQMLDGCAKAEEALAGETITGGYIINVVNQATFDVIYSHGYGAYEGQADEIAKD